MITLLCYVGAVGLVVVFFTGATRCVRAGWRGTERGARHHLTRVLAANKFTDRAAFERRGA